MVSGRVVRAADGAPIGGAVVVIAAERHVWAESAPPSIVTTANDGTWSTSRVEPGLYVLTVTATGFAPQTRELQPIVSGEQRRGIDIPLDVGGVTVIGIIKSEQGDPISSVRVRAYREGGAPYFVAFSGSDGRYQLSLASGHYQLEVTHDEYRRAWENIATTDDKPVTADFTLVRGGVVRGQVVARDTGEPLANAEVNGFGGRDFSTTRAGADGTFTLRGLHDGTITIAARGRGYATVKPSTLELGIGGQAEHVRVLVDPAFSIVGRVVAKEDHTRGLGGVMVNAMAMGDRIWPVQDLSDADGNFELVGLLPGEYMLSADKRGMLFEGGVPVEIGDTDVSNITIEMRTGATVSGRVDPPGIAQIALARVGGDAFMANDEDAVSIAKARAESDARGVFTLRDVPSGDFEVIAMAKDGKSGTLPVTIAGADQSDLVIRLSPRVTLTGRVVDTNGAPVSGVYVFNNRVDAPLATRFKRDGIYRGATTAADGVFKIVGLEAGAWQLSVTDPKGGSNIGKIEVDVSNGRDRDGVTITIDARDASLRGTVVGPDRKPVSGAQVRAMREVSGEGRRQFDSPGEPVGTDASGNFAILKLRAGSYTVVVEGPRGASRANVSGVKTGESVTITLAPLSSLTIAVTHAGAPAHSVSVSCWGPAGTLGLEAEFDEAHTFSEVAQGEWRCDVSSADGSASATVMVGNEPAKFKLALDNYASVTGVAVDVLTGQPVSKLTVMARGTSARTDDSGQFVLQRLPAGSGELLVMPTEQIGVGVDKIPYTAQPGERLDLGRIKVVPPRNGDVGTFGLTLEIGDKALTVAKVKNGGPADIAGIKVGDSILAVNALPVVTIGLQRAQRLITSESVGVGQTVTLTLANGSSSRLTAIKW